MRWQHRPSGLAAAPDASSPARCCITDPHPCYWHDVQTIGRRFRLYREWGIEMLRLESGGDLLVVRWERAGRLPAGDAGEVRRPGGQRHPHPTIAPALQRAYRMIRAARR